MHTNLCLRTFFDTNLFLYELPRTNFLHTNFFRYEDFTYEPYPIRTFSITNYSRYEPYTIRTLSHTNLCLRTLAYEPFPIRTLCLRTSVLDPRTRQDRLLYVPRSRTEAGKWRFRSRAPGLYNRLPRETAELGPRGFSRAVKRQLLALTPRWAVTARGPGLADVPEACNLQVFYYLSCVSVRVRECASSVLSPYLTRGVIATCLWITLQLWIYTNIHILFNSIQTLAHHWAPSPGRNPVSRSSATLRILRVSKALWSRFFPCNAHRRSVKKLKYWVGHPSHPVAEPMPVSVPHFLPMPARGWGG